MGFALDAHSISRLTGVHPDLVRVVQDCAANGVMPFTFGISQGLRTVAEQAKDVAAGKSKTMNSRHLDGHAVDLVVLVDNAITWSWPSYDALAEQMKLASVRTGVPIIWGGCWDKEIGLLGDDMEEEAASYVLRAKAAGGKGFLDGPHFELPWGKYPSQPEAAEAPAVA